MKLIDKINEDIKTYMKNKDTLRLNVVRMVKSSIQLELINSKKETLEDDEVINIISKQIKMRNDSISEFKKASRDDLIKSYEEEIKVLKEYMPAELSEEEVISIIDEALISTKSTSIKEMKVVMKEVTPKVRGRFDMATVSNIIKSKLN